MPEDSSFLKIIFMSLIQSFQIRIQCTCNVCMCVSVCISNKLLFIHIIKKLKLNKYNGHADYSFNHITIQNTKTVRLIL